MEHLCLCCYSERLFLKIPIYCILALFFQSSSSSSPSITDEEFDQLLVFTVYRQRDVLFSFLQSLFLCFSLNFFSFLPSWLPFPHSSFPHQTETTSSLPRQQPPYELLFLQNLSLTVSFVSITLSLSLSF